MLQVTVIGLLVKGLSMLGASQVAQIFPGGNGPKVVEREVIIASLHTVSGDEQYRDSDAT